MGGGKVGSKTARHENLETKIKNFFEILSPQANTLKVFFDQKSQQPPEVFKKKII